MRRIMEIILKERLPKKGPLGIRKAHKEGLEDYSEGVTLGILPEMLSSDGKEF